MGSPESGQGAVDCGVGSIVWVRRRNGSWWPGKILGPDELSASHLMSPRSGTPVKLLGREDASVDWYNLEKSKRVKPFRCGEFDDSIERAEASQGMPPKKREKYARREDAILHALELERQLLGIKCAKMSCSSNEDTEKVQGIKEDAVTSSEYFPNGEMEQLHPNAKRPDSSCGDEDADHHTREEKVEDEDELGSGANDLDVLPRMRGLQDLGLRTTTSKQKLLTSIASNGFQKLISDSTTDDGLDGGLRTEGLVKMMVNDMSEKEKSLSEGLPEESFAKKRDKRRPLVQVMQNSVKFSASKLQSDVGASLGEDAEGVSNPAKRNRITPAESGNGDFQFPQGEISPFKFGEKIWPRPADLLEETASGSTEDTETDSSETDSAESDSDEGLTTVSDGAASIELQPKYMGGSEAQPEEESMSSGDFDGLGLASDMSHPSPNIVSTDFGVSKWQMKGKRNNRGLSKRPVDKIDKKPPRGYGYLNTKGKGCYAGDEADSCDNNFQVPMSGYKFRDVDDISRNMIRWEDLAWCDQPDMKGYWDDSSEYVNPIYLGRHHISGRTFLMDVDLKVQSSYQRERVPLISLMNKNGQAIVGHPVQIEVLEDNSSETLVAATDGISGSLDNEAALPSMWRTARRTANFRVPRPHLSPALDGDDSMKLLQFDEQERKSNLGSQKAGIDGHKVHAKKILSQPAFSRKVAKKMSLSSNQKIRTLSSIASQQKESNNMKRSNSHHLGRVIKPECVPTAVACIPVKLVFSRLHEELVVRHL